MKKSMKIFIGGLGVLALLGLIYVVYFNNGTIKDSLLADVSSVIPSSSGATLAVKLGNPIAITNTNSLFGFNTEKTFSTDLYTVSNSVEQVRSLKPDVLRFPGGMVGNFYHPKNKGYGFVPGEYPQLELYAGDYTWSQKQDKDLLDYFINYSKQLGVTKTVYVANIYTGTVAEMKYVLDTFKRNGITVVGVELGNEMMYKPMIDTVKNGSGYVRLAQPFIQELRTNYPEIKIGAVAWYNSATASVNGVAKKIGILKTNEWMRTVAQNLSFDAWVIHHYPDIKTCDGKTDVATTFICIRNITNLQGDGFPDDLFTYVQDFAQKEIWVTEFNVETPATRSGNTFLHAATIFEFLLTFQDSINKGTLTLLTHHNLMSTAVGMPALYRIDGTLVKSAHGEALKIFRTAEEKIIGTFTATTEENPYGFDTVRDFIYRVYTTDSGIIVIFVNKSNQTINLALSDASARPYTTIKDSSVMEGQALYASQRSPAYRLKGKSWETKPMTMGTITSNTNKTGIVIPPFTLGYGELVK